MSETDIARAEQTEQRAEKPCPAGCLPGDLCDLCHGTGVDPDADEGWWD